MDVFIGWDSRFPEPALVLAASILERASIPVEIHYLHLENIKRKYGFDRPLDPKQTTEFTYTRFLVPFMQHYEGKAIFLDNDMLVTGDIAELAGLPMEDFAIRCVHHDHQVVDGSLKMNGVVQTAYPRKNWSSMMLLNCEKLRLWTKPVVEQQTGAYLHRFQDIPDEQIGELDPAWNQLDSYDPGKTKLIHWTSGMVWNHPDWKELRAAGKLPEYPHRELWLEAYDRWCNRSAAYLSGQVVGHPSGIRRNLPDPWI